MEICNLLKRAAFKSANSKLTSVSHKDMQGLFQQPQVADGQRLRTATTCLVLLQTTHHAISCKRLILVLRTFLVPHSRIHCKRLIFVSIELHPRSCCVFRKRLTNKKKRRKRKSLHSMPICSGAPRCNNNNKEK